MIDKAQRFYCSVHMISDETEISDSKIKRKWKDIKMSDYKKEPWYNDISDEDKSLLDSLS